MNKFKKLMKTIARISLVVAVLGGSIYGYSVIQNNSKPQTALEICTQFHDFYVNSGYNTTWEYEKDLKTLQEFKQEALDKLSYKQTILLTQGKDVGDERLAYVDETIALNLSGTATVEKPEYLTINSKAEVETKSTSLDFIKLLK